MLQKTSRRQKKAKHEHSFSLGVVVAVVAMVVVGVHGGKLMSSWQPFSSPPFTISKLNPETGTTTLLNAQSLPGTNFK